MFENTIAAALSFLATLFVFFIGMAVLMVLCMLIVDILHHYGLRKRIRIIASGKLVTPAEVAWALCVGTDFIVSARGFMFSLGCIQALKCNRNTCPTGITTHNPRLQKGLDPDEKYVKVANYCNDLVHEVEVIAHSCGVAEPRQLRRKHVRIVQNNGRSMPLDELYPLPATIPEHQTGSARSQTKNQTDNTVPAQV